MLTKFFKQENKAFRNFQLVYTFLTLNFFFPAISYGFFPEVAVKNFLNIGKILGAVNYPFTENEFGYVWRCLATSNVFTLSFMCFLLQLNIKKFYLVLIPLVFLKTTSCIGYLLIFLLRVHYPAFLAIFFYDGISALAMVYFAKTAYNSLQNFSPEKLVPNLYKGN